MWAVGGGGDNSLTRRTGLHTIRCRRVGPICVNVSKRKDRCGGRVLGLGSYVYIYTCTCMEVMTFGLHIYVSVLYTALCF